MKIKKAKRLNGFLYNKARYHDAAGKASMAHVCAHVPHNLFLIPRGRAFDIAFTPCRTANSYPFTLRLSRDYDWSIEINGCRYAFFASFQWWLEEWLGERPGCWKGYVHIDHYPKGWVMFDCTRNKGNSR